MPAPYRRLRALLALAGGAILLPATLRAGEISAYLQSAAPSADVALAFENDQKPNGWAWFHNSGQSRGVGQSFRLRQDETVAAITVKLFNVRHNFRNAQDFTLEIYRIDGVANGPLDPAMRIAAQAGSLNLTRGNAGGYLTFELAEPVRAEKEGKYLFLLRWKEASAHNVLSLYVNEGYADGERWADSGEGIVKTGGPDDLVFYIQRKAPTPQ